jgi:hypothetical protein
LDEAFNESLYSRRHLCEASLRLLAALGSGSQFPEESDGVEALIGRAATGRPGEAMSFGVEQPGELPRYTGEYLVWVSAVADGCLRLRHECGGLRSEAVVLKPDGRLGKFESISGFGVPDSELTEQAHLDREALLGLAKAQAIEEKEVQREIDEDQRRFRTEHLLGVYPAPPQDSAGPVVTFVVRYETGVIVQYLIPRPPDEDLETEDPWAEPLQEAMFPGIQLSDGSGTTYKVVDWNSQETNAPLLRASQSFAPAVPEKAERLAIRLESHSVEIELAAR